MDEPSADPGELRASLRFIERINRWLGYGRVSVAALGRFSRSWERGRTIRVLDLATGSADIPRKMLRWADAGGHDLRIVAVDVHPVTIRAAASATSDSRISLMQADVFSLPFGPRSFDYVHCAMFMHHLPDERIVELMRIMDHLAARGVIISDLLRHRRAYWWTRIGTLASNRIVRHDAPASVAAALTKAEAIGLRDRAGLGYLAYRRHFAHRFSLAGERPSPPDA